MVFFSGLLGICHFGVPREWRLGSRRCRVNIGNLKFAAASLVLLAACGGAASSAELTVVEGSPTVSGAVEQVGDEFFAPEFSLTLSDGTLFDTAQTDTPIYVMFWAEW